MRTVMLLSMLVTMLVLGGCVAGSRCSTCPPHTEPAQAALPR